LPSASISEAVNAVEANILVLGMTNFGHLKQPLPSFIDEIIEHTKKLEEIWVVGHKDVTKYISSKNKKVRVFQSFQEMDQAMENLE
jgi:hypothetical protein